MQQKTHRHRPPSEENEVGDEINKPKPSQIDRNERSKENKKRLEKERERERDRKEGTRREC